ncbi:putative toxin-antitoxin system toxin component, PIN family [Granulicella pectinivorans]|uniref:Putative toxin-antitoxin system toxin component, PIN family n=1 Tax=Granulicella pectinivorans TaxID=474950 RepID=A0A1I6N1G6_9BACT|nr:putative toxin-antitoxin system toxin component, PIN family [Granulicella pectinivorans]SFS21737.1 putative toxin-antitoxin system toxin component, PIN family [Granulicella pectinivorans]
MNDPLKVILDTAVLVAAFRSRIGASNAVLRLALQGAFKMGGTITLFLEYTEVLHRPEQLAAHGISPSEITRTLGLLAAIAEPIPLYFRWRPQLRDPNDEMVLDAAINGRVDAIVTHNVRDFLPEASRFNIRVLTPAQFLSEVKR